MKNPPKKRRNKPSLKKNAILKLLRTQIASGRYQPGQRIPTRDDLEIEYSAGRVTIQRVMDDLMKEGFVESRGRAGTVVVDRPPHLAHYGLVFPFRPTHVSWTQFFTTLVHQARQVESLGEERFPIYYEEATLKPSKDGFHQLRSDSESHRLAGLIFAASPHDLRGLGFIEKPPLPCVMIGTPDRHLHIPTIQFDGESFTRMALDHLLSQSRRKIALIGAGHPRDQYAGFKQALADRSMWTRDYWLQTGPIGHPAVTKGIAHLLFHANQHERPDGLIIGDDNLVPSMILGLLDVGIRVPEDLSVVAHCNFPWPTPSLLPVKHLGYDSRQLLQLLMESIDLQIQGGTPPPVTMLPAVFGDNDVEGPGPFSTTDSTDGHG
jgi:DNA-binding LacI/PurR family transcriptional regulator